jgi:tetratricopeptide (TPR) repeat protein
VCTAGPSVGSEFVLKGEEAVVGRATDNAVSIPDTSVSRKHVLLRRTEEGWAASDMGSGNGTLVNGEPIVEETPLQGGDVITLGDTVLEYTDRAETHTAPAPIPPPRRTSSRTANPTTGTRVRPPVRSPRATATATKAVQFGKRRKVLMLLLLVVVVGGSLGTLKLSQNQRKMEVARQEEIAQQQRAKVGSIFQEGKNLVREGKWSAAKVKFDQVAALAPNYPSLADYLERASKEIPNQQHVDEARAALQQSLLGPARVALDQVTPDTQLYEQVRGLRAQVDSKLEDRLKYGRSLVEGRGIRDLAKVKELQLVMEDLLVAFPDHRDAAELLKLAKANVAELSKPVPGPVKIGPMPWKDAAEMFRNGDVAGAQTLVRDCAARPCKVIGAQLAKFQDKYARLPTLPLAELEALLVLDQTISGGEQSKSYEQINAKLTGNLFKTASSAKAAGDWGRAMEYSRKTLKADPGHNGAQAIAAELRGKAKELYLRAYQMKEHNTDDALKMFKDVMAITPRDDEHHQRAKNWVEKLQR